MDNEEQVQWLEASEIDFSPNESSGNWRQTYSPGHETDS